MGAELLLAFSAGGNWDHSASLMLIVKRWEIPVSEHCHALAFASALADGIPYTQRKVHKSQHAHIVVIKCITQLKAKAM